MRLERKNYRKIDFCLLNLVRLTYNKLWKQLIDKKMSAADLRKEADIAPNTMTRMKKDQEVTIQVLERICEVLDSDFGEIMEYIPDVDKKRVN